MTGYQIICQCNPKPSDIPNFCQPGFFFNETEHLQQQSTQPFYLLTAVNQRSQQAEARCAFFLDNNVAVSPKAAPFGSIEFAENLPESVLDTFLQTIIEAAQSVFATTLRVVNYPYCYAPQQMKQLLAKLSTLGFQVVETNQTFYLPVTTEIFTDNLIPAERRRLRKCAEAGLNFQYWSSPNVANIVNFLQETRQQQGYELTICPDKLANLLQTFPNQFLVFMVNDGPRLAALSVAVRVREDILYSFLPASHSNYRTFSPMVMLTYGLYTYCQQQGIRLLDLGTSLDENNQPKHSLMRFKRNLGAQESPKFVFEKHF
ncbi:GNAT family N-acetyltransferase [Spirosoma validum]|uniref:GNAT family N-acetyltransferase n=1 Tax=Spirosoma validum TaxID=2771355 RepID=A0A927GCX9_9BACT|nr:GNAT family N-acetyltransferase [Spirosoma validum]MBD2753129.1 GNAT family N-acetyltransferase [Spirosoma validum]